MNAQPGRTAFAIGVLGRLGEALLQALAGAPQYSTVYVATRAALVSSLGKLRPCMLALDSSGAAIPSPIDDVYCCMDFRPGLRGRDRAYFPATATDVPAIARLARGAGARRFVLVTPLTPLHQLTAPGRGMRDAAELELVKGGFQTLVLFRPSGTGEPASGNLFERIAAGIGGVLAGYLIPQSMQPLRPHLVARAALEAPDRLGPGTHVMDAPAIRRMLGLEEQPEWLKRRLK
jgi:hypothetical protein